MIKAEKLEHPRHHITPWHEHESGQIYWLRQGVMVIETPQAEWSVISGAVGWFPPGLRHRARVSGPLTGNSLYFSLPFCGQFPPETVLCGADAFVLALLERLSGSCQLPDRGNYQANLIRLLSDEIALAPEFPLHILLPEDRRARNVAEYLLEYPGSTHNQAQLASNAGLSVRSLSRLFREQTGLSFSQWRQQEKLVKSLSLLLAGASVSEVAGCCGYSNVSAYIAVFRQRFGQTPGQLQARQKSNRS